MKFKIEINYKKGPSLTVNVEANSAEEAKAFAVKGGKQMGFFEQVKKMRVEVEQ